MTEEKKKEGVTEEKLEDAEEAPTVDYEVGPGDTLTNVAARFDSTPSELRRINRLFSRSLIPGRIIQVPTKKWIDPLTTGKVDGKKRPEGLLGSAQSVTKREDEEEPVSKNSAKNSPAQLFQRLKLNPFGLGDVIHRSGTSPTSDASIPTDVTVCLNEEEDPMTAKYVKFGCEFVVDLETCVPGLLLVTTTTLMFTPVDVPPTDVEQYSLMLPLERLRSVAMYKDQSVMFFTRRDHSVKRRAHTKSHVAERRRKSLSFNSGVIDLGIPDPTVGHDPKQISNAKSFQSLLRHDSPRELSVSTQTASADKIRARSETSTDSLNPGDGSSEGSIKPHGPELKQKEPKLYLCILASSVGTNFERHPLWCTLQSMEFWFQMPSEKSELLLNFFKTCQFALTEPESKSNVTQSATVKSSEQSGEENTEHTVFVPVSKAFDWVLPRIGSIDERSKSMMSNRTRSQSFKDTQRVRHQRNLPTVAKRMTVYTAGKPTLEEEKLVLQTLKRDSVLWELGSPTVGYSSLFVPRVFKVVNSQELRQQQEESRRQKSLNKSVQSAMPERLPLPLATSASQILDQFKVRQLMCNLPAEAEGLDWSLTYSTAVHGFNLRTLYHQCAVGLLTGTSGTAPLASRVQVDLCTPLSANEPCLMAIRTTTGEIFGAMLNTHPYMSGVKFFGNGSCYVFRWIIPSIDDSGDQTHSHSNKSEKVNSLSPVSSTGTGTTNAAPPGVVYPSFIAESQEVEDSSSSKNGDSSPDKDNEPLTKQISTGSSDSGGEEVAQLVEADFQKYTWTGKNTYFIRGDNKCLTVGCSQGHAAIYLDDVLLHGRTEFCETFDNEPLCSDGDFTIANLELWSFR
ncbi:unnamed protein product [Calicophoron daubneyi]|uniref:Oxidation resistance protein 1 n=1 Tax=Calicophoron daubneyi TaxID=300641 RepID=A0AAV2TQ17_CALDB